MLKHGFLKCYFLTKPILPGCPRLATSIELHRKGPVTTSSVEACDLGGVMVGGVFSHPFWKICGSKMGSSSPNNRGEHPWTFQEYLKPPPNICTRSYPAVLEHERIDKNEFSIKLQLIFQSSGRVGNKKHANYTMSITNLSRTLLHTPNHSQWVATSVLSTMQLGFRTSSRIWASWSIADGQFRRQKSWYDCISICTSRNSQHISLEKENDLPKHLRWIHSLASVAVAWQSCEPLGSKMPFRWCGYMWMVMTVLVGW